MTASRVPHTAARVDFSSPLSFSFDGRTYSGFKGDTLASALLANGVRLVARSFKYGRPRGIASAGVEEPNALVQLELGAATIPNLKATTVELYDGLKALRTSGHPSLERDYKSYVAPVARFMPAGFYYKTFQSPRVWRQLEPVIRAAAGYGEAPREADPDIYDHQNRNTDVLIVGGGACGLAAARIAARTGLSVIVVDEQSEPGGWLLSDPDVAFDGKPGPVWLSDTLSELASMSNVRVMARTTAFAMHDYTLVQAVEQLQDHLPLAERQANAPRQRQHRIRAKAIILATGAIERPVVFGNNDLPGIMTASALVAYANRYGVACGKRVLLATSNDAVYPGALALARHGCSVSVADARPELDPHLAGKLRSAGIDTFEGYGLVEAQGRGFTRGAHLVRLEKNRNAAAGNGPFVQADCIGTSGGLSPTVHLFCHNGGRPTWDEARLAFVAPALARAGEGIYCAGAVTGAFSWQEALQSAHEVMTAALSNLGKACKEPGIRVSSEQLPSCPPRKLFRVPDFKAEGHGKKAFVDLQNDVTAADIHLAVRENYKSIEHVKRYTGLGFGTDQGKLSNVNGFAIAAEALGKPINDVGTTTYRPVYTPVTFGALAGAHEGETFDPKRFTPMHAAHVARGALFEPVGQWMRPWYFPKTGEDIDAAVKRECLAARRGAAIMDASTLGKIDIRGRDAREFLNRVYANSWTQLAPGKCRYGLMLDENGMVMDDGVTSCLADDHFFMTTTTGGAARVMSWLELWHQTEWPDLDLFLTSVTDHWATAAVVGPKSRDVVAKVATDVDLSPQSFKFMEWRDCKVAGVPARVCRISFSGELAYEINVEAGYGHHVWEALMAAGAPFDIAPYGTETMHVLRAEKGFIIVGQDTDGSVSPFDLDMAWAVAMKKPFSFIGKRSLARSDTARKDRKQFVGILTDDPKTVLKEGAQIVENPNARSPVPILGHVTSSYFSAELGRSIALGLVTGGIARRSAEGVKLGQEQLYAWAGGRQHKVRLVSPVFVDPEGKRQHG